MNTRNTLPALAAAPALLPLIAPVAVPILIGGAIAAGIVWLFSDDKKPAVTDANTKTGNKPTAPKRKRSGLLFFDVLDDEPETASPAAAAPLPQEEVQRRIRENEAEIARHNEKIRQHKIREAQIEVELQTERARRIAGATAPRTITVPAPPAAVPGRVTPQAVPAVVPAPRTAAVPAVAVPVKAAPGRFQLKARKYDRAHLEAVLKAGPLPRTAIVKALKAAPFGYGTTLAYTTLQRFADFLEESPEGLLAWKPAQV